MPGSFFQEIKNFPNVPKPTLIWKTRLNIIRYWGSIYNSSKKKKYEFIQINIWFLLPVPVVTQPSIQQRNTQPLSFQNNRPPTEFTGVAGAPQHRDISDCLAR
jgi:hypothetical protein